jgi:hypothetical protein
VEPGVRGPSIELRPVGTERDPFLLGHDFRRALNTRQEESALHAAEKLILTANSNCFVTGHDFSHADKANPIAFGLTRRWKTQWKPRQEKGHDFSHAEKPIRLMLGFSPCGLLPLKFARNGGPQPVQPLRNGFLAAMRVGRSGTLSNPDEGAPGPGDHFNPE